MAVTSPTYLLKIGGVDFTDDITGYKVGYMKLWSEDTGRSMKGSNKGTLVGIFPKLSITMGSMSAAKMSAFLSKVNTASQTVDYYDTERQNYVSNSFYFGDAEDELARMSTMRHKPITISVIANERRT